MTGGKDGSVIAWSDDFSEKLHTFKLSAEHFGLNEPPSSKHAPGHSRPRSRQRKPARVGTLELH